MNAADFDHGPPMKVRAIKPGDTVWIGTQPQRVASITESGHEWYKLTFENTSMEYSAGGRVVLERADQWRTRAHQIVNITGLAARIVDAEAHVRKLEAELQAGRTSGEWTTKVQSLALEIAELEEQHERDLERAKNLERQIRAQDKAIATQRDTIDRLRTGLATIKSMAHSVEE